MPNVERIADQIYEMFDSASSITNTERPERKYCLKAAESCIEAKTDLIELLRKHPNWDEENLRIHFKADYERPKQLSKAHTKLIGIGELLENADDTYRPESAIVRAFDVSFFVYDDDPLRTLGSALQRSASFDGVFLTDTVAPENEAEVKKILPNARIHAGQKCTKALNKLLLQYGYEDRLRGKHPGETINPVTGEVKDIDDLVRIRKAYTDYADCMNPLDITRHTVISVNPMDFLNMSNGNSGSNWSSCHRIPADWVNRSSWGEYSAGCWSYAYDSQTMIFYTVDTDTTYENITKAGKYTRQLYMWNGKDLLPSRLYPQNDDLNDPLYRRQREIVEKVVADCLGCGNLWKKLPYNSRSVSIDTNGRHYPDYVYNCYPIFRPSFLEIPEDVAEGFAIGSDDPICVSCGRELDTDCAAVCAKCAKGGYYCTCCHDYFQYEDDGSYVDGEWICEGCLDNYYRWDELNEEYIDDNEAVYVEGLGYTSEHTADYDDDIWYCDDCDTYYWRRREEPALEEDDEYGTVCHRCFTRNYTVCERCGAIHAKVAMYKLCSGGYVCPDCVDKDTEAICDTCGTVYPKEDVIIDTDYYGREVCKDCYEHRRVVCSDCGRVEYTHDRYVNIADANNVGCPDNRRYVCGQCKADKYAYVNGFYLNADDIKRKAVRVVTSGTVRGWNLYAGEQNVRTIIEYMDNYAAISIPINWLSMEPVGSANALHDIIRIGDEQVVYHSFSVSENADLIRRYLDWVISNYETNDRNENAA